METSNDEQKYFNPENYATKIIGEEQDAENENTSQDKISNLISLLTEPENKDFREEALLTLKKEKAGQLLIDAIQSKKGKKHRAQLVAACWESEIDFSSSLDFFASLACDSDYLVSLEAITVIETMEGPFENERLQNAIQKIRAHQKTLTDERQVLFNDLVDMLNSR